MKKSALFTMALCAISSGAFAQTRSGVMIPAFQDRYAGIHAPVVAVNPITPSSSFQTRTFGGSSTVVTSPSTLTTTRARLDPTVVNIPVFPGNTVLLQQQGYGFIPFATGLPPNAGGFGNTGFFIQQGTGSQQVDPFGTTATPSPAVNAVPDPAAPTLQPTMPLPPGPTTPQQTPAPAQPIPGTPIQTQPRY